MRHRLDLTSQRFGKLTALRVEGRHPTKGQLWLCACDCGGTRVVIAGKLSEGKARSCGCIPSAPPAGHNRTHGLSGSPEHTAWEGMRRRCADPRCADFVNYGGRGITVCAAWRESFEAFLADVGPRPSARHSIDRVDNSRGYEPGNVRWATPREQQRNRRNNRRLTIGGETLCVAEWAERFGVAPYDVRNRMRCGWDVLRALTTPVARRHQTV